MHCLVWKLGKQNIPSCSYLIGLLQNVPITLCVFQSVYEYKSADKSMSFTQGCAITLGTQKEMKKISFVTACYIYINSNMLVMHYTCQLQFYVIKTYVYKKQMKLLCVRIFNYLIYFMIQYWYTNCIIIMMNIVKSHNFKEKNGNFHVG